MKSSFGFVFADDASGISRTVVEHFAPTTLFVYRGQLWMCDRTGEHKAPTGFNADYVFGNTKFFASGNSIYQATHLRYELSTSEVERELVWESKDIRKCRDFRCGYISDWSGEHYLIVSLTNRRPVSIVPMPPVSKEFIDYYFATDIDMPDVNMAIDNVLLMGNSFGRCPNIFLIEDVVNGRFISVENSASLVGEHFLPLNEYPYLELSGGIISLKKSKTDDNSGLMV